MTYNEAISYIHSIPKFVRPLGNENLGRLLNALGNPHSKLEYIHIAGTNGKGSVCAMLSSILTAQGYRTGMFTSPFIEVFNERIQINNENIPDTDLVLYTERVKTAMEENGYFVSEFAFICAVAFLYFYEQKCEYVVLETGMGGRLDATNIIKAPLACVLTSIGLDHMEYLGDTIEEITLEKCGIIKQGAVVISEQNKAICEIIEESAKNLGNECIFTSDAKKTENGFIYKGTEYQMPLLGEYQKDNGAAVIETVLALRKCGVEISDTAVKNGLKSVKWPIRFEFVRDNVIIDGGHNPDGIKALKKSLMGKHYGVVIAMMQDKAVDESVKMIADGAEFVIATQIPIPRCKSAEEFARIDKNIIIEPDFKRAIDLGLDKIKDDTLLCICGSLYFGAEAKKYLKYSKK
ncbi:MAG: bifunctional folylpolyglutamate synthase/dihydrofolate synthase [Clostridia bacterium]|nr:bifunctional folylpolyglutamate synthase/dihydrofolate synthase [Clostridia bacterium]